MGAFANDFNRKNEKLMWDELPRAIVSGWQGCYHQNVNRPKKILVKITFFLVLATSAAMYAVGPAMVLPSVPASVDSITPGELRTDLEFLASQELGGRYTLAPSFAIAARYIATRLESFGFKGAGEHGDFLQTFQVISAKPDPAKSSMEITIGGKTSNYHFGDFFVGNGGTGSAEGPVVFVGTGISSVSQKHDDYAGLDVKGKIVLIVPAVPSDIDDAKLEENEVGQGAARLHGAVGVLQLPSQRVLDLMKGKGFAERFAGRETIRLARGFEGMLPAATLGPAMAEQLLASAGVDLKQAYEMARKQKLQSKKTDISVKMVISLQATRSTTQNVAGILEGSDPRLKNEYVVFSAHYDHLKTSASGEVYPGADDDGSGTTAILAIAHAMSLERPKRSVLVMFHAGEELGLLGSAYNTDFAPVVPLDKLVADLNIDMIGRSKPPGDHEEADERLTDANSVYLVGSNRISQELHQISEETNSQFQKLKLDYYYNDPENPERIYYRSDHWNYAKHGIPVIFYFDGVHVDYHRPTDTVDKIDFQKMTKVTRLVFETGWRIANLDHRLAITH
jgi:Peptidase family M28